MYFFLNISGVSCEDEELACDSGPCYNDGLCENIQDEPRYHCHCRQGQLDAHVQEL